MTDPTPTTAPARTARRNADGTITLTVHGFAWNTTIDELKADALDGSTTARDALTALGYTAEVAAIAKALDEASAAHWAKYPDENALYRR